MPDDTKDQAPLAEQDVSEQARIRREKLQRLQADGRNPYAVTVYPVNDRSGDILARGEEGIGREVCIAGRMVSRRVMGKASFAHLQDGQGRIQIYVRREDVGEEAYAAFKDDDLGDILGVSGTVFRTQKGELSVQCTQVQLLSKSLLPLPEKYHGLKDPDLRYRQRYLDMIVNPEVKDVFLKRSLITAAVRRFLTGEGFLEVDTPVLHMLETGAAARPFLTHHNTLDIDMYLRIELELYLKRLIVGGIDRVFELGRIFRNEGMSIKHNPEFTMCELYQAYTDYHGMMDLIERLFSSVALEVTGSMKVAYQGEEIDLTPPWPRLTMADAVKKYIGVDYYAWQSDEEARQACRAQGLPADKNATRGDCLAAIFDEKVEDFLVQPVFICDYPVEISPLAKRCPGNPQLTERFEFFMTRREMGNAFTELNDPIDQRERFLRQVEARKAQGIKAQVDEDYVTALEYGLPPTGGLGFGFDRFVMLLTDSYSIRDVILFPTMKPRT